MGLPSIGQISMGDINVELGRNRTQANTSLWDMERGFYIGINQSSTNKPNQLKPCFISEWRGYRHIDIIAPSIPANLVYTYYDTLSGDDDMLTWSASTDNVGVVNYHINVRKNGLIITGYDLTTPYLNVNYNYFARTYGSGTYDFMVCANDAAGNLSAYGISASYVMNSERLGAQPTSLYTSSITNTSFVLNWASSSIASIGGYKIFKNSVLLATVGNVMGYAVTGLSASTMYSFSIQTIESGTGFLSQMSNSLSVTTSATSDTTPPSTPTLSPLLWDEKTPLVYLSWSASTDAAGVVEYEIWKSFNSTINYELHDTTSYPTRIYRDYDIFDSGIYRYKIMARDAAGNRSAFSNMRSVNSTITCFIEGTLITLADGTCVPVESLVENDLLLSSEIETLKDTNNKAELFGWSSDELIENRVISSVVSNDKFVSNQTIVINNGLLEATYSHGQLIMRDNIWRFVNFKDMVCGDYLYDDHSNLIEITDIKLNFEPRNVYKLLLGSKSHMYFANNTLTHNPIAK